MRTEYHTKEKRLNTTTGKSLPGNMGKESEFTPFRRYDMQFLSPVQQKWVELRAGIHIFKLAIFQYRSVGKTIEVLKALYLLKKSILGSVSTRIVKINGRFHHYLYAPGYPSRSFDNYIKAEFNRIIPIKQKTNLLTFCIFAITKKCPLQCEHCFEWNNLNKKESFTQEELLLVVKKLQKDGLAQLHLSGGEPMVRVGDLVSMIGYGNRQTEYYVLTSGYNFTSVNAKKLKQAGLTGVIISLDHFDEEKHNIFRGLNNSYRLAMQAVISAQEQNLVVALTLCPTKAFTTWENLMQYAEMAKRMKVPFIQILEPKATGHYEGMDVSLNSEQLSLIERFYQTINFDTAYNKYPIIIYHGYHLRRVGCFSGGNRMYYINSEGFVNACPFCSARILNIKDAINDQLSITEMVKGVGCHQYKNARS